MKAVTNLIANWPAPANIRALSTTRKAGNLALHVGDDAQAVLQRRRDLMSSLSLPSDPAWLEQIHSNHCVIVESDPQRTADAAITRSNAQPLAIMTADCLPILLCDKAGTEIAAIHAGWKGLLNGIVENTLYKLHANPNELLAWIGPAICEQCYETGEEMRDAYISRYPFTKAAFSNKTLRPHTNLPKLAQLILNNSGVTAVTQSQACTFCEDEFYSYRRHAQTGRIATLIWFTNI